MDRIASPTLKCPLTGPITEQCGITHPNEEHFPEYLIAVVPLMA